MRRPRGLAARARRRGRDEHGAILVVVAGCLVLFLALLAYTIDLGSGRQTQQKAQLVADAAAEAGANAIPYPVCSSTDTTCQPNVRTQASTIATTNGACSTCVTVNYPYSSNYSKIQVIVTGSSAGTVGAEYNRASIPVSASAIASAQTSTSLSTSVTSSLSTSTSTSLSTSLSKTVSTSTSTSTTPPTNTTPTAIFAYDKTCTDNALTIGENLTGTSPANNINLQGSIFSNGAIGIYYANGNFGSSITYGSRCSFSHSSGGNFNGGQPTTSSTTYAYPDDFRNDTINCDHSSATYSWTGTDLNLSGGGIYCATTSITVNLTGNLNASGVTFVAPKISITVPNLNMSPAPDAPDNLEIYNSGSSALTIDCSSNLNAGGGAIFSPTSAIDITAENFNNSEFIEGYQVHLAVDSINVSGNGAASGAGSTGTTTTKTTKFTNTNTVTNTITNTVTNTQTGTVTNTNTAADGSALSG